MTRVPAALANTSPGDANTLLDALIEAGEHLRSRPVSEIVQVLGRAGSRFLDSGDPMHREAVARIPDEAGLSNQMAEEVVRGMARDWTAERLDTLVSADFPDRQVLDGFADAPGGGRIRALGGSFAFHVGAGNVPGVGATSLLRSLLVKCPVLLKPGRGDRVLSQLLLQAIEEEDPALASAVAVIYWRQGEGGALEEAALRRAERVVAYGGFDAFAHLRERTPPTTPLVAYHHRISMGAVAREILDSPGEAQRSAREAARAVALFDRRGCVSPQMIWVEEGGAVSPLEWAESLAIEMEAVELELPAGPLDPSTATEIAHRRGAAEMRSAGGSGERVFSGTGGGWTLFFQPGDAPSELCGGRTAVVRSIGGLESLAEQLFPYHGVLQTMALAAPPERRAALADSLALAGFSRITTFAEQPFPPAWWRHDGEGPLRALVRWVEIDGE